MTIGGKHTFRDFSMIPKEIPVFSPAIPKTNYIDVPCSNGSLDYTEINNSVVYENRKGSFEFIVLDAEQWADVYSAVMFHLQGRKLNCILDDDPTHFYTGRFAVNEWKSNRGYSTIVIDYNVEPYKHGVQTTGGLDWLWNELFDNVIYYGTFDVDGSKIRNLINPSSLIMEPSFTCSATMFVDFGDTVYTLPMGKTTHSGILLRTGDNVMTFRGTGRVLVDYDAGAVL
jgi:hypothetical protein